MSPVELKVARIGNSRGVRIPATTLERYQIGDSVMMEERDEGILLRPRGAAAPKLSWKDTALAMAAEAENWDAWDATAADGLQTVPWDTKRQARVAESAPSYAPRKRSGK